MNQAADTSTRLLTPEARNAHKYKTAPLNRAARNARAKGFALAYFRTGAGVVWFLADVLGGAFGAWAAVDLIEAYTGHTIGGDMGTAVRLLAFVALFLVGTSGQFFLTQFWDDWFNESAWSWVTRLLPYLPWLVFTTGLQVALSAAGYYAQVYGFFDPTHLDRSVFVLLLFLNALGSIGGQHIVHLTLVKPWED